MLHKPRSNQFRQGRFNNNRNNKFRERQRKYNEDQEMTQNINKVKGTLIEYIYKTIDISRFKYKLIEYESDLNLLKDKDMRYLLSPNYNGIQGLLIFTTIKDQFYSFIVDRRTLNYNKSQLDLEKVKVIPINIRLDKSIYKGTIIDGVLLYNNMNGVKNFVVNDIYYFRGQDLRNDKITNKMTNISQFIDAYSTEDDVMNNTILIINKLYELNEIQQLVNLYIPKSKYSNSIKGVAFYPEHSGTKLIYLFNNCATSKTDSPTNENVEKTPKPKIIRESKIDNVEEDQVAIFRLKKTSTIDVYQLHAAKKIIKDEKTIIKYVKYGIAYIPTKECSYFCKDIFDNTDEDTILVYCKYYKNKEKWVPFKHANDKKRPDYVDKIEGLL